MVGLTEDQLRDLAGDVKYEHDMLRATAVLLSTRPGDLPVTITNALLESFLIHHRNLVDFLSPRKSTRETDATAAQYLGRDFTHRLEAPLTERDDIDRRLAHVSIHRRSADVEAWPYREMFRQLEEAWNSFLAVLESEFPGRAAWFVPFGNEPDTMTEL